MYINAGQTNRLSNVKLEGNSVVGGKGGSLFLELASIEVTSMSVRDSKSLRDSGGAISCLASSLKIMHSSFANCSTTASGGAVYGLLCKLNVEDATFTSNHAAAGGAVMLDSMSEGEFTATKFDKNFVTDTPSFIQGKGNGGALATFDTRKVHLLSGNKFSNNQAKEGGAVAFIKSRDIRIFQDASFDFNQATDGGGGGDFLEEHGFRAWGRCPWL